MNRILSLFFVVPALPLMAANPAFQDFNSTQFKTSGNKVAVTNGALFTNTVIQGVATIGGNLLATNATASNYFGGTLNVRSNASLGGTLTVQGTNVSSFVGNVGIGTNNPVQRLDVNGRIAIKGNQIIYCPFFDDTNFLGSVFFSEGGISLTHITGQDAWFVTALGWRAGLENTTGGENTFIGGNAGLHNTSGSGLVFVGSGAGQENTTAHDNVFVGADCALLNTLGSNNVFVGPASGGNNLIGSRNTYVGNQSGKASTNGTSNTGLGNSALVESLGSYNTAVGAESLLHNTTGDGSTAVGYGALYDNTSGVLNTSVGYQAGYNAGVALTGNNTSVFLGYGANTSINGLANVVVIGATAQATQNNQVVLGNSSITETILRGVVSPLDVKGPQTAGSASLVLRNGDTSITALNTTQIRFGLNNTDQYQSYIRTRHDSSASGNAIDFYTGDGTASGVFPTNAVLGLTINNGNVGIGTTTPASKLDVSGDIRASTTIYATGNVASISGVFHGNGSGLSNLLSQTPWTSDIDGAGYNLTNAKAIKLIALPSGATGTTVSTGNGSLTAAIIVNANNCSVQGLNLGLAAGSVANSDDCHLINGENAVSLGVLSNSKNVRFTNTWGLVSLTATPNKTNITISTRRSVVVGDPPSGYTNSIESTFGIIAPSGAMTGFSTNGFFGFTSTNTMTITSTGLTNSTTDTYLLSITAGVSMALADADGTVFLTPLVNSTVPFKPGWRFTAASAAAGVCVVMSK